jgi:hypothetical protein
VGVNRLPVLVLFVALSTGTVRAEDGATTEGAPKAAPKDIEEVTVEGSRVDTKLNPVQMGRVRSDNGRGARLYRMGLLEEAFPYLRSAAEKGFKMAQARLSYIYQVGPGKIQKDPEAAIGWIGVAASPVTDPEVRNYYNRFMARIPPEDMPRVEEIIETYRARYGTQAVGMHCNNVRTAGSHISLLKCDFDHEFDYDVLDLGEIELGITNSAGSPTEAP